jgi:ketosteroid isomerase-like protein
VAREKALGYRVPPLRDRSRRSLLDQVGVRLPRIARPIRVGVLRLSPRSRLRRVILAKAIRDNAEAFNRRDYEALVAGFDREITLATGDAFPETNVYRGHEGMRDFLAMVEEVWRDYRIEPETLIDLGGRYVLLARHHAHGRGSGVGVNHRVGLVGTLNAGAVISLRFYWSPDEALEAAGLQE